MAVVFRRCGDLDRDKFRLRELVEHIRDPRGRDEFSIRLEAYGAPILLTFPNDPCTINDRLINELKKHYKVDVRVEELEGNERERTADAMACR